MHTLDRIRAYFVLNRIKNGASPYHLRPLKVDLERGAVVATWPRVATTAAKRARDRVDNVANEDEIAVRIAADEPLPETDDEERAWLLDTWEYYPASATWHLESHVDPDTVPESCPCHCGSPSGWLDGRVRYNTAHECIFKAARCACGCEDDESDSEVRARRLEAHLSRGSRVCDPLLEEPHDPMNHTAARYRCRYQTLKERLADIEDRMVGISTPAPAMVKEHALCQRRFEQMRRLFERYLAVPQHLRNDRSKLWTDHEADIARAARAAEAEPAPECCTLVNIDTCSMPLDAIIDGTIAAVQQLHSLRVFHRGIRMSSFSALTPLDTDGTPSGPTRVVLGGWDDACFNPGNSSYRNDTRNTFAVPRGEVAPEISGDVGDRVVMGFEYDIWCLGLVVFELMYGVPLTSEIDPADYRDEWLDTWIRDHPIARPLANAALYKIVLRVTLTTVVEKRAASYALMNMTDGPRGALFDRPPEIIDAERTLKGPDFMGRARFTDILGHYAEDPVATARLVHRHVAQPRCNTVGHWLQCRCMTCAPGVHPIEMGPNKTRTERTRVMYAMACAHTVGRNTTANVVLAVYSQLADAVMTDHPEITIDLADYGITADAFEKTLDTAAVGLSQLRIRI